MFCLLLIIVVFCGYGLFEDIKDLNPIEILQLGKDVTQLGPFKVNPSDVKFYLKTQSQPEPILINTQNRDLIDTTKNSKFVIHGWIENYRRSWYQSIANEYLKLYDINFIEVDWEIPSRMPYIYSAKSVGEVGNTVAQFIKDVNLSPEDIHIIGHSLGAHVAGITGNNLTKSTGKKLARISGLDPAGPYFRQLNVGLDERLDKEDAVIVDVIHTDDGFYGYENPIGTLDIYVNGGQRIQPGCLDSLEYDIFSVSFGKLLEKSFCSHARSTKYFMEWINAGKFTCKFCKPVLGVNLFGDRCLFPHQTLVLGSEDVTENITGVCYTRTNSEEPYLS